MNSPAVHATVVAIGEWGVAMTGPSGSGKSDLALRLIDRGAVLVCDDYVLLTEESGRLFAAPAPNIAGKMEIRGLGIIAIEHLDSAPIRLLVELGGDGPRHIDSLPQARFGTFALPALQLDSSVASSPIKVELALKSVVDADIWPVPDSPAFICE